MSNRGKKRKEGAFIDDSDSGSEEVGTKPTKKEPNKGDDSENGVTACELSKNRKVVVRQFKSMILVDIREYWSDKDGELKPGKKGISLTADQWKVLRDHMEDVDDVIAALR